MQDSCNKLAALVGLGRQEHTSTCLAQSFMVTGPVSHLVTIKCQSGTASSSFSSGSLLRALISHIRMLPVCWEPRVLGASRFAISPEASRSPESLELMRWFADSVAAERRRPIGEASHHCAFSLTAPRRAHAANTTSGELGAFACCLAPQVVRKSLLASHGATRAEPTPGQEHPLRRRPVKHSIGCP